MSPAIVKRATDPQRSIGWIHGIGPEWQITDVLGEIVNVCQPGGQFSGLRGIAILGGGSVTLAETKFVADWLFYGHDRCS